MTFYFTVHFSKEKKSGIFGGFSCFFKLALKKIKNRCFLVGSNCINPEDNYGRLTDFLSQISKCITTKFPVSFLCKYSCTPVLVICASFRASSLNGSSDGLIISAHTSPYLFFPFSNFTFNSHNKKREFSCVLCAHSQFLCSLQVSNCQPWVSDIPHPHTY